MVAALVGGLLLAPPAAADGEAPPVDWTAWDGDANLAPHATPVADYVLRATLDPAAHTVHGEGRITWRNTSRAPTSELWVHLYLNAFKNERSVFVREPVEGGRGGGRIADWGTIDVRRFALVEPAGAVDLWPLAELRRPGDDDETDVRVPLPHPVEPGASITIDVVFDDKLPTIVERTGYFGTFHMVAQWFPKLARLEEDGRWAHFPFHHLAEFYADYGTYDVTIDVPEGFVVGACGPILNARTEGGRRIERRVLSDVHDFAFATWDRFLVRTESIEGVAVTLLYPPGYRSVVERELVALRFAIPYLGHRYGRYPYPVLTLVHVPEGAAEAGGMEYPTLITTRAPWYGPPGILVAEQVTVHELGHQWFYGLVGSDEVSWPFLDEGLNSFAEQDTLRRWRGAGSIVDLLGFRLDDGALMALYSAGVARDQHVAQPAYAFASGGLYGRLVYGRTAATLETLRRVYGDDAVMGSLGRYARRHRFQHPGPDALLEAFAATAGAEAKDVLQGALFEKGTVDFAVLQIHDAPAVPPAGVFDGEGGRRTVPRATDANEHEGWVLLARRGTLVLPVELDLVLSDGTRLRRAWDGHGEIARIPYRGAAALVGAVVDPDERVLLDDDRTNNHASTAQPGGGGAPRTLERLLYFAELVLSMVAP
jgi:hypothetical protein